VNQTDRQATREGAAKAVKYARASLLRELRNPAEWVSGEHGCDDRESERLTDALIAAVRHHDAEIVRDFAEQEDRRRWTASATVYVHGIRAAADRLRPGWASEVEVRYVGGPTIRIACYSVTAEAATGTVVVEGFITSSTGSPSRGDAVRLAYLGIPGRGALADITASVELFTRLDVPHIRIRTTIRPEVTP